MSLFFHEFVEIFWTSFQNDRTCKINNNNLVQGLVDVVVVVDFLQTAEKEIQRMTTVAFSNNAQKEMNNKQRDMMMLLKRKNAINWIEIKK